MLIQSALDMVKLESEAKICVNCCLSYKSSKSNFIFSFKSKVILVNKTVIIVVVIFHLSLFSTVMH